MAIRDDHIVEDEDDLEMKPLVGSGGGGPSTPTSPRKPIASSSSSSSQKWRLRVLVLCACAAAAFLLRKPTTADPSASHGGKSENEERNQPQLTHKAVLELQKRLTLAEQAFEQRLREQYGTYYDALFFVEDTTTKELVPRGRSLFTSGQPSSTVSRTRFQRKLALKVLEATSRRSKPYNTTFVWATGGHSATAGHGNFYHESYTAYLEEALQPLFSDSVNIQFTGRNYAMGGTAAAPEVAWCAKEIFGTDMDVLVWDYGMTDGSRNLWKQALYHIRGSLLSDSQQPPIHFVFHAGSNKAEGGRYHIVQSMEEAGVGALISSEDIMDAALAAVPDSFGLSDAGIADLPEFVQNFRCDTQLENGDPYCKAKKYHLEQCPERKFQTNWHPGWKWHALMGYLTAFFVIDVLKDALTELAEQLVTTSAADLYLAWKAEEWNEYQQFLTQIKVPASIQDVLPPDGVDGLDVGRLVKGANFCHTAKLPAEIRHLGILTETTTPEGDLFHYDTGLGLKGVPAYLKEHQSDPVPTMPLVYTEEDRQKCPIPTNMDYKDYFYLPAAAAGQWHSLTVPNLAERRYYSGGSKTPLHGYVAVCLALCPWGACPPGVLDRTAFTESQQLHLRVNGVEVTEFFSVLECELLRHADGYQFPVDPHENHITLEAQLIADHSSYMRFSSVIVW